MARLIERVIKKPLSELLLFGSLADGGTLRIARRGRRGAARRADAGPPAHEPPQPASRVSRASRSTEDAAAADPFEQFARWFEQARATEADATAMTLATATPDGRPSARMVLLKGVDARGFVFYTNYDSRKAGELDGTHRAALLFYWPTLERQVRIEGDVTRVADAESDAYFASRPLESRWSALGVAAEPAIASRECSKRRSPRVRAQYGDAVPRPAGWGGFRVSPGGDRVLAGPGEPPSRSARVRSRRWRMASPKARPVGGVGGGGKLSPLRPLGSLCLRIR